MQSCTLCMLLIFPFIHTLFFLITEAYFHLILRLNPIESNEEALMNITALFQLVNRLKRNNRVNENAVSFKRLQGVPYTHTDMAILWRLHEENISVIQVIQQCMHRCTAFVREYTTQLVTQWIIFMPS